MLVLSRLRDESIMIGPDIRITVVDIRGDKVRLGVDAPKGVGIHRKEIYDRIRAACGDVAAATPEVLAKALGDKKSVPKVSPATERGYVGRERRR